MGTYISKSANNKSSRLKDNEQAYVSRPENNEPLIAVDSEGRYRYLYGFIQDHEPVDKNSAEYRRALSDYNVKVKFNSDGSVTVAKGGIYNKKRQFNSIDTFQKETNTKIDKYIDYYKKQEQSSRNGYTTQIEAEALKSNLRETTYHTAIDNFTKGLRKEQHQNKIEYTAAQDMKSRLSVVCDNAKRKLK